MGFQMILVLASLMSFACAKSQLHSQSQIEDVGPQDEGTTLEPIPENPEPAPQVEAEPVTPAPETPANGGDEVLVTPTPPVSEPKQPEPTPETKPAPAISSEIQEGDIIFQISLSGQSAAISEATNSKWTHVALVFKEGATWYAYEASSKVMKTPLKKFMDRGRSGIYVVKRINPKVAVLDKVKVEALRKAAKTFFDKPYDIFFEWSDSKIYCSELVFKAYLMALQLEVGKVERWRDMNLNSPKVQLLLKERLAKLHRNLDLDQPIVTPAAQFNSDLLVTVRSNSK